MKRSKLEGLVWKHTHPDYRAKNRAGENCVLHLTVAGTTSAPLSSFSALELANKLPSKIREANGL